MMQEMQPRKKELLPLLLFGDWYFNQSKPNVLHIFLLFNQKNKLLNVLIILNNFKKINIFFC